MKTCFSFEKVDNRSRCFLNAVSPAEAEAVRPSILVEDERCLLLLLLAEIANEKYDWQPREQGPGSSDYNGMATPYCITRASTSEVSVSQADTT